MIKPVGSMCQRLSAGQPGSSVDVLQCTGDSVACCYNITYSMRRLTTAIRSEKCVVRRFRRCANVI